MLFENTIATYALIGVLLAALIGLTLRLLSPPFGYQTHEGYRRGAVGE